MNASMTTLETKTPTHMGPPLADLSVHSFGSSASPPLRITHIRGRVIAVTTTGITNDGLRR